MKGKEREGEGKRERRGKLEFGVGEVFRWNDMLTVEQPLFFSERETLCHVLLN